MITKKNLMKVLEKLPDDVEICLCIKYNHFLEESYAVLDNINFEDLNQHNIIYLEGTEDE